MNAATGVACSEPVQYQLVSTKYSNQVPPLGQVLYSDASARLSCAAASALPAAIAAAAKIMPAGHADNLVHMIPGRQTH